MHEMCASVVLWDSLLVIHCRKVKVEEISRILLISLNFPNNYSKNSNNLNNNKNMFTRFLFPEPFAFTHFFSKLKLGTSTG